MKNSQKRLPKFLRINERIYSFNLNKICDFISERTEKTTKEIEILENYDYSDKNKPLSSRNVRELNSPSNGLDNIVYDLLKIFIVQVIVFEGDGDIDIDNLPFGTKLAFNTLLSEGFLIEIENE